MRKIVNFTEIKSEYVKKKIKGLKLNAKNKEYIEALMRIDGLARGRSYGRVTGYMIIGLKEGYPKEWDIIHKEFNPKHITLKEEERREKAKDKKLTQKLRRMDEQERKETERTWKKVGGA